MLSPVCRNVAFSVVNVQWNQIIIKVVTRSLSLCYGGKGNMSFPECNYLLGFPVFEFEPLEKIINAVIK